MSAFFMLHQDLPREAPADRASLDGALAAVGLKPDARILDAACGPGADIDGLLAHAPKGKVTACDLHGPFVSAAKARFADDPRVEVIEANMISQDVLSAHGPFDLIWCNGAAYFVGVTDALRAWRPHLSEGGAVAFTDAAWRTDDRPADAVAHWQEYPAMTDTEGVKAWVVAAGYAVETAFYLSDAAWEAYYTPMDARIAELRRGAGPELAKVLDEGVYEAEMWRKHRDVFGYLQIVARPE